MAQGALAVPDSDGATVLSAIDAALLRLATKASGTSRPSDIQAHEYWIETDNPGGGIVTLWHFDGTTDILAALINTTAHKIIWYQDGVALASTADVAAAIAAGLFLPRAYLAGLGLSNNAGAPNTKIDVAAGMAMDSTNAALMVYAGGTLDCGTTGANGLDTGALANSTWYHVFLIAIAGGARALLASTSATVPAMPGTYTLKRRLGSFKTDGSAHILAFVQDGDLFQWNAIVNDIGATNPGTAAVTRTLSVPSGVNVVALVQLGITTTSGGGVAAALLSDLALTAPTPGTSGFADLSSAYSGVGGVLNAYVPRQVRTNLSSQIRSQITFSDANVKLTINTIGWIDRRGRD